MSDQLPSPDDPVAKAINEGENSYRQTVLSQGPLPGYPVIARASPSADATAGEPRYGGELVESDGPPFTNEDAYKLGRIVSNWSAWQSVLDRHGITTPEALAAKLASSAPTEAQCAECARLRDGLAELEHDFVMAPDGDGNRVRCIYWSDVEELLAGDRAP